MSELSPVVDIQSSQEITEDAQREDCDCKRVASLPRVAIEKACDDLVVLVLPVIDFRHSLPEGRIEDYRSCGYCKKLSATAQSISPVQY
ncbi:hypothetical protein MRB53_037381 [Persea americana]|nr:hypothetical protein MRB53_037381 [Persea americana]